MIDEELYKRATEELDSDARKPDIWARACALASDDHDEARFLYTNLRVEEMLNKDGKQRTFSASRHPRGDLSDADKLESLDLPDSIDEVVESTRTGISNAKQITPDLEIAGLEDSPHSSVSGTDMLGTEVLPFDDETMAELDTLSKTNASDAVALSGITGQAIAPAKRLDKPGNSDIVSEVISASSSSVQPQILSPEEQKTTKLTQKLERQAANMSSSAETTDILTDVDAEQHVPDQATKQLDGLPHDDTNDGIRSDYADATDLLSHDDTQDMGVDLDSGVGRSFLVFSRRGVMKAIKRGVSWPALLFTFPWLLSKAMIGTAMVYAVLWFITIAGLYTTGTSWLDAGAGATTATKVWTMAFGALAIIGLLYIPFRHGNRWVAEKLQRRGFEFEASVSAGNKRDAVDRLLRTHQPPADESAILQ